MPPPPLLQFVTMHQLIDWMRNPIPKDEMKVGAVWWVVLHCFSVASHSISTANIADRVGGAGGHTVSKNEMKGVGLVGQASEWVGGCRHTRVCLALEGCCAAANHSAPVLHGFHD